MHTRSFSKSTSLVRLEDDTMTDEEPSAGGIRQYEVVVRSILQTISVYLLVILDLGVDFKLITSAIAHMQICKYDII